MKQKSLKKNAILNAIKQICAVIFPLISFKYATRILGVVIYGKINFGSSIISYISLIAGLGISNYAVREGSRIRDEKKELSSFVNEIFTINVFSTLLSYLVFIMMMLFWRKLDDYKMILIIQSMNVLTTTIGMEWLNMIFEDYKFITIKYIVFQILSIVLMFVFVKNPNDYLLYSLSSVSGVSLANITNYFYITRKYGIVPKMELNKETIKHFKPIMIMFGTSIASLIYINSDITLLGIIGDDRSVGLYSVASKIYTLVKQVISAFLVVAIPRISNEIHRADNIKKDLDSIFRVLIMLIFPSCVGLFMLSEKIIIVFSSAEFYESAKSLEILSVSLAFAVLANFYINIILISFNRESIILQSTIISAFINIAINILLIPRWGQTAAAISTLISEIIMFVNGLLYSKKYYKFQDTCSLLIGLINGAFSFLVCSVIIKQKLNDVLCIILCILFSVLFCALTYIFSLSREYFVNKKR